MKGLVIAAVLAIVLAATAATAHADALAVTLSAPPQLELGERCRVTVRLLHIAFKQPIDPNWTLPAG
jgi:hypothetical protein